MAFTLNKFKSFIGSKVKTIIQNTTIALFGRIDISNPLTPIEPLTVDVILTNTTTVRVEFTWPVGSEGQIEWKLLGETWGIDSKFTTRDTNLLTLHRQNIPVNTPDTDIVFRVRGITPTSSEYIGIDYFSSTLAEVDPNPGDPDYPEPWVSQCSTCPNTTISLTGKTTYTPTSAADLANVTNANKVAIITNSFSITGTTFAVNQIIQPNGGILTGTSVNINGARFIMNNLQAFAPTTRFTTRYSECLTPEIFGADTTSNDKTAIEAMLINADMGRMKASGTYNIESEIALPTVVRTFKWIGNNATITDTNPSTSNALYVIKFNTTRPEICNLTINMNQKPHKGIEVTNTDLYMENVKIWNSKSDVITDSLYGVRHNFYSATARDTRYHNCEFGLFDANGSTITTGAGATRGIYTVIYNAVTNPVGVIHEVRDCQIYSCYGEGDGMHYFPISNSDMDHNIIFKIDNCQFWDNTRRDIKFQGGGAQITRCTFTKINSANPEGFLTSGSRTTTVSVGLFLRAEVAGRYHKNGKVIGNIFQTDAGDLDSWAGYLGLSYMLNAVIRDNTFTKLRSGPFYAVSFGAWNPGTEVYNNVMVNCGIQGSSAGMVSTDGTPVVRNNSFTYDGNFWNGYKNGIISLGSSNGLADIRNLNFHSNEILVNIPNTNALNNFGGILGTRPGWNSPELTGITINNNNITYIGASRAGAKFLFTEQSFGNSNTVTNNTCNGVTASGAMQVNGTDQSFVASNNVNDLGQTLTKL